ncbi:MAG: hypothetical protein M0027_11065 [Candidatus Dormibacteraeota bacterium]|nr:hypothetical protein [Candidatus Dormibacteraeota bacterium]
MVLYRLTRSNPPSEQDFLSAWDLGRRPPAGLSGRDRIRQEEAYKALSMLRTLEAALRYARKYPKVGSFVSKVAIPAEVRVTNGGDHANVHGVEPRLALTWVLSTTPVSEGMK